VAAGMLAENGKTVLLQWVIQIVLARQTSDPLTELTLSRTFERIMTRHRNQPETAKFTAPQ
jgi:hypothetical protein